MIQNWMDGWMKIWMEEYGWMDGWIKLWMDYGWMSERMGGWIDRIMDGYFG